MNSPGYRVVGVFPDRQQADLAVTAAIRAGIDPGAVSIGEQEDEGLSIEAEMQEEMDHADVGPGVGMFTMEMTKGIVVALPIATVAGLLIGLACAFIPIAGWALISRVLIFGIVGASAGATIGFLVGGALGANGPGQQLAAERGVVVSALAHEGDQANAVADSMAAFHPIRVDFIRVSHDNRMGSSETAHMVETEHDPSLKDTAATMLHRFTQTDGEPSRKDAQDTPS